jgi:hypothetical protein
MSTLEQRIWSPKNTTLLPCPLFHKTWTITLLGANMNVELQCDIHLRFPREILAL